MGKALATLSKWACEPPGEANARCWARIKCRRARKENFAFAWADQDLEHITRRQADTMLTIVVIHK